MSTVIAKNVQVGADGTASNNFTVYQPATPDGTLRIGNGNSGTTSSLVTLTSAGAATVASLTVPGATALSTLSVNSNNISAVNSLGFRNRIINGDMRIDQRNAGASVNVTSAAQQFAVDRFQIQCATDGTLAAQRSTTAPAGFTNSLLLTVSVADASLASGQIARIRHKIEGFNAADLAFGTAGASSVTISFWVRSSVTGTFAGYLINSAANRSCPFTFTINSANTFEQKSVTLTGDTTGTWLTDSGVGVELGITLGAGSAYNGTANTWAAAEYYSVSGVTNLLATSSATFYITGVQLEAGSVATPFERRDYGRELMMCQRYYEKSYSINTAPGTATNVGSKTSFALSGLATTTGYIADAVLYRVVKRATPTVTFYDLAGTSGKVTANVAGVSSANNQPVLLGSESNEGTLAVLRDTGGTASNCVVWHFTASAEL